MNEILMLRERLWEKNSISDLNVTNRVRYAHYNAQTYIDCVNEFKNGNGVSLTSDTILNNTHNMSVKDFLTDDNGYVNTDLIDFKMFMESVLYLAGRLEADYYGIEKCEKKSNVKKYLANMLDILRDMLLNNNSY